MIIKTKLNSVKMGCYDIIKKENNKSTIDLLNKLNANKKICKAIKETLKSMSENLYIINAKYITTSQIVRKEKVLLFPAVLRFDQYREYLNKLVNISIDKKMVFSIEELPTIISCESVEKVTLNDNFTIIGATEAEIEIESDQSGTLFDSISEQILARIGSNNYKKLIDLDVQSNSISIFKDDFYVDEYGVIIV